MDNIRFIKDTDEQRVSDQIAERLNELSRHQRLLWLVPGGSAARIASLVSNRLKRPANLVVSLTDERFGPIGHEASNWRLLIAEGFNFPANSYPVLVNKSLKETVKAFSGFLAKIKKQQLYTAALFGMGADGHIAGILPGSLAVASRQMAIGYQGQDYTRLTVSGVFASDLDEAFIYAYGPAKHTQIERLSTNISPDEQPVQLLKHIPRVHFFNDRHG